MEGKTLRSMEDKRQRDVSKNTANHSWARSHFWIFSIFCWSFFLPASLAQNQIKTRGRFLQCISFCQTHPIGYYRYQPWIPKIIKRLSTRMKLEANTRQAKIMVDGNGHWMLGSVTWLTSLWRKRLRNLEENYRVGWGKASKWNSLPAYAHARR